MIKRSKKKQNQSYINFNAITVKNMSNYPGISSLKRPLLQNQV